jgi:membrane fusion protein, multidrug efflux system
LPGLASAGIRGRARSQHSLTARRGGAPVNLNSRRRAATIVSEAAPPELPSPDQCAEKSVNSRPKRVTVIFLVAISLVAAACNKEQAAIGAPAAPPPALVTVTQAVAQDVPLYLDEIGKNAAYESVMVMPQVAGRITERHFEDGSDLKKDQLLFVIDPRPYQAALDSAQAQLAQAQAALDLANAQLKMYAAVADTRAVSQFDYETRKNAVEVDKAQVQLAQAAIETAKLNLDYCYIHSPIDGRASARLVDVGNVVQANTTPLLSIQRIDPIYADFTITERDLPQVRQQMDRGASMARVKLPADPDTAARSGKLTFLDNSVQNGTGTVNLRATIPNSDRHFWPGTLVDVKLVLATLKNAVLVPYQSTQISQKGPFVYVVKSDSTVDLRPVTLGQRQGDNVVVSNGLVAGETVVVTGQLTIGPGAKVRTASAASSAPQSGGAQSSGSGK